MKPRKIPMRKCVVTQERFQKKELLRVVRTPEGEVIYDKTGKANGRGVYLSKSLKVIETAKKNNVLKRHLEIEIPESVYLELIKEVDNG
jgi:hypothetical protein